MFLCSRRNSSTCPQVEGIHLSAPNVQSSLVFSHLTPTPALDSASEGPQRSSVIVNSNELAKKIPCTSLAKGASNSSEDESQLLSLESRSCERNYKVVMGQLEAKCYVVQLFEILGIDLLL